VKIAQKLALAAVAGVLTIGGASVFAAGSGSSNPSGDGSGRVAAKAFVCAHLGEVQAQQQLREELLTGRLTLLQEAKDAATSANHPKVVAKIDAKIATNNTRMANLKAREAKVTEACATATPASTTTTG
jgi:hypothetical protein